MPKRKFTSKKRKVTKYQKKMPRYRNLPLGGIPDRKTARLKYVELISMDASALASAVPLLYHFRANSLFDPNLTGVGHQPRGFDELAAIYDHYCVIGSKIKVTFESDVDHIQTAGQYVFLMLQDTNTTPGNLIDIMEGDRNVTGFRPRSTTAGKSVTLYKKFSPYRLFGIPKKDSLINNVNLNASVGANPAEDAIYTIGLCCARTTTTNPPPVVARVEIEYLAVFLKMVVLDN